MDQLLCLQTRLCLCERADLLSESAGLLIESDLSKWASRICSSQGRYRQIGVYTKHNSRYGCIIVHSPHSTRAFDPLHVHYMFTALAVHEIPAIRATLVNTFCVQKYAYAHEEPSTLLKSCNFCQSCQDVCVRVLLQQFCTVVKTRTNASLQWPHVETVLVHKQPRATWYNYETGCICESPTCHWWCTIYSKSVKTVARLTYGVLVTAVNWRFRPI